MRVLTWITRQPEDPIQLEENETELIQCWQQFNETGTYGDLRDLLSPEDILLRNLDIYAFSDKYLIEDLREYSQSQANCCLARILGQNALTTLPDLVQKVYDDVALVGLKVPFVRAITAFDNSRKFAVETLKSKSEFWDDFSRESAYYNYVFDRSEEPRMLPPRDWYRDELSILQVATDFSFIVQRFVPVIRQLIRADDFQTANECVRSIWDLPFPRCSAFSGIRFALFQNLQPTLKTFLRDKYISQHEVYDKLLKLIPVLAKLLGIPIPNVYRDEVDFLRQARFGIIATAANLSEEAAAYLQSRASLSDVHYLIGICSCDNESELMAFLQKIQVASESELNNLQTLPPNERIEELQWLCSQPLESVREYLEDKWDKIHEFFRTIAVLFVCLPFDDSNPDALDRLFVHEQLFYILEICRKKGGTHYLGNVPENDIAFAQTLRPLERY